MLRLVLGLAAAVGIGATALSWMYNNKTEEELKREEELKKDIDSFKSKFASADFEHNEFMNNLREKEFDKLKKRILQEVTFFREEKKDIKDEFEKVILSIKDELKKEYISPYQRKTLLENINRLEDAKNRIDAYWLYLDWFEKEIEYFENKNNINALQKIGIPNSLLPEDYLYIGKLAYIEKDEISFNNEKTGWNIYGQKLQLDDYFNKLEIEILNDYNQEFVILITNNKNNKFFSASVIKGELYKYILDDLSFEVRPKFNEKINQENIKVDYKGVWLSLNRKNKEYPLKQYKEYDSFEVKILEYDLLLKNIEVTEKFVLNNSDIIDLSIPIIFIKNNFEEIILSNFEKELFNSNFLIVNLDDNILILRISDFQIKLKIKEKYLELISIEKVELSSFSKDFFSIPYQFTFIEEKIYNEQYLKFDIGNSTLINEFKTFLFNQISYINYTNKKDNTDFLFFKKWGKIIDYQILKNTYETYDIEYSKISINDKKILINIVDNKILKKLDKKNIEVELNTINIGALDDIDVEKNIISINNVDLIDDISNKISNNGFLKLKVKSFQYVLQRQKKALKDFSDDKIVNQELKQLLISPSLIKYTNIKDNIQNIDFKNKNLTSNQKDIIKKVLNEKNIFLIQGPPGTGKTTVIKEMVFQILKLNNYSKILIVSQQNIAVDNVLNGLYNENIELFKDNSHSMVRIVSNENKIQHENIKQFTLENWFQNYKEMVKNRFYTIEQDKRFDESLENSLYFDKSSEWLNLIYKDDFKDIPNEIKELLISSHQILGATCMGLANKSLGLDLSEFDIAIIDEAGRATAPELLIPILRAKKVVLIGDHNQLPPTVDKQLFKDIEDDNIDKLTFEDKEVLEKSFFEELYEKIPNSNKMMLNEQFRMPKKIGDLISELFYESMLKNGHIKDSSNFIDSKNIVKWIDVKGIHEVYNNSSFNDEEVKAICILLDTINKYLENKKYKKTVGIITPYTAQKNKLRKKIDISEYSNFENLKIDTVDSFQGEEADIIIYSTVKTFGNISFLLDKKRLNVAISRTKENLFFVGNKSFFENIKIINNEENLFKKIITLIDTKQG